MQVKEIEEDIADANVLSPRCAEYKEKAEKFCTTPQCVRTAAAMLENMDTTVSPCHDFWQYSCGGYLARVDVPPGKDAWGIDNEVVARIRTRVRRILESPVVRNETRSAERKFKTFYNKCMDEGDIERLGAKPFLDVIDQFGGWVIQGKAN